MQRRLLVSFFHANNRGELVFMAPKWPNKKTPYKCRNVVQFSDTYCALDHKPCMQFRQEQRAHLITDSYARLAIDFSRSGSRLSHHRYYGTPRPLFFAPAERHTLLCAHYALRYVVGRETKVNVTPPPPPPPFLSLIEIHLRRHHHANKLNLNTR